MQLLLVCAHALYAERIDYDGNTWHTTCFKCLQCKSEIPLARVAMISGDLYCKNCFMRIFKEKGPYSSFGEKTLPKAEGGQAARERAATHDPTSSTKTTTTTTTSSSISTASLSAALPVVSERRSSVVLPCQVADCKAARQGSSSYCAAHVNSPLAQQSEESAALFDAVSSKNVDKVNSILNGLTSSELLFAPNQRGASVFETAFSGIANSRNCGEAIVNWLKKHNEKLEAAAKKE